MFFTADQIVAHAVGDYLLQPHAMAQEKVKRGWRGGTVAFVHAMLYSLPFSTFLNASWPAWVVIIGSHFVIDHWRLARFVGWAKNLYWDSDLNLTATGYPDETPAYLAVWLLIITDNVIHVLVNGAALHWL